MLHGTMYSDYDTSPLGDTWEDAWGFGVTDPNNTTHSDEHVNTHATSNSTSTFQGDVTSRMYPHLSRKSIESCDYMDDFHVTEGTSSTYDKSHIREFRSSRCTASETFHREGCKDASNVHEGFWEGVSNEGEFNLNQESEFCDSTPHPANWDSHLPPKMSSNYPQVSSEMSHEQRESQFGIKVSSEASFIDKYNFIYGYNNSITLSKYVKLLQKKLHPDRGGCATEFKQLMQDCVTCGLC